MRIDESARVPLVLFQDAFSKNVMYTTCESQSVFMTNITVDNLQGTKDASEINIVPMRLIYV